MKLTEEQVKEIVAKVYKDLELFYEDKIPIKVNFIKKSNENVFFEMDYWSGKYDYSKAPKELELDKGIPYDSVIVDDVKGIAIAISNYPIPTPIVLDKNGNYIFGKE